jgi:hypothetical protein
VDEGTAGTVTAEVRQETQRDLRRRCPFACSFAAEIRHFRSGNVLADVRDGRRMIRSEEVTHRW